MLHTAPSPVRAITGNPLATRNDMVELLHSLLEPLLPCLSPGAARVNLGNTGVGFDTVAAEMEGYARVLWGLAPLLALDPDNAAFATLRERWVEGLINGTDPAHLEYWGDCDGKDQRLVEMAAVAFALAIAPSVFWEPLPASAKARVNRWLLQCNTSPYPANNWRFFRILVNLALKLVGGEYDQKAIDDELAFVETFHGPDGFAADGPSSTCNNYDYYATSFAIPFYELIYAKLCATTDPQRASLYRERARANVHHLVHLFAPDGGAIPFGRSMTYRFACSAFFAAVAFDGTELPEPFSWGVVKGILLRNIRGFTQKEEVFNRDGTLTIGWSYPNFFLSEDYNSPQSPYWALKAFLPLALPETHPFWAAEEEPYPTSLLQDAYHVAKPWMQVMSHAANHTFLMTSGQHPRYLGKGTFPTRGSSAKYGKFAYSSVFGFSVPTGCLGISQHAPDSVLALSDDDEGERWVVPRMVEHRGISDNGIISSLWKPWPDVSVEVYIVPPPSTTSAYHTRVYRVVTSRHLKYAESGFSNYAQTGPLGSERLIPRIASNPIVEGKAGRYEAAHSALTVSRVGASGVVDLFGNGTGKVHDAEGNSNLCFSRSVFPSIVGEIRGGETETWIAVRVFAMPFGDEGLDARGWKDGWDSCQKGWASVQAMREDLGI